MSMKEMKNLRYIITFLRNLLQFELYTFDFLKFNVISNIILFEQSDTVKNWSKSLSKLFKVILMIKLPTNSVGVLSKFTTDKLMLLENKAILATKAFRLKVLSFVRFLIIHYQQTIIDDDNNSLHFNHLDIIMNQLFNIKRNKHNEDIINNLWSIDKLETEFKTEYEMKQKYQSSAFLKGIIKNDENEDDDIDILSKSNKVSNTMDIDSLDGNNNKKSKLIGKKRKRDEMFDITNKAGNEMEYKQFIKEQCYILIMDKILPFCMDFDNFFLIIIANKFELYHEIINRMNDILLHFIKNEKWWYLSHIINIYNDLFENQQILKEYLKSLDNNDTKDIALNIKYGIYSFMIWICYFHQFTPKPVICFFDKDFNPEKILKNADETDVKRQKLLNSTNSDSRNNDQKIFETLKSVQQRITELSLAKSVLIKLLITMVCSYIFSKLLLKK